MAAIIGVGVIGAGIPNVTGNQRQYQENFRLYEIEGGKND